MSRRPPVHLVEAAKAGPSAALEFVAMRGGAPIRNRSTVTFVYIGEADSVDVRQWSDIFPHVPAMAEIEDTEVWWTSVPLPHNARLEYKLEVTRNGSSKLMPDPLNTELSRGPLGANSVARGPGLIPEATEPAWAGSLVDLPVISDVFGEVRRSRLYVPYQFEGAVDTLLVVHDGSEYLEYGGLARAIDRASVPIAALLLDPTDRLREYGANDDHATFAVDEALPAALSKVDTRHIVGVGASFGGVASLHAAWRNPGRFDGLILQSGSFVRATGGPFRRSEVFSPVIEFMDAFHAQPGSIPTRLHMSCGEFDGLIEDNRRFVTQLVDLGATVEWFERPDGHNWGLWRDVLPAGIRFVTATDA